MNAVMNINFDEIKSFKDLNDLDLDFDKQPMCVIDLKRGSEESRHLYEALTGIPHFRGKLLDSETNWAPDLTAALNAGRERLESAKRTGDEEAIKAAKAEYEHTRQAALETVIGATMAQEDRRVYKLKLNAVMQVSDLIENQFLVHARQGMRMNPEMSSADNVKATENLIQVMLDAAKVAVQKEMEKSVQKAAESVATGMVEFFPEEKGLVRA